LSKRGHDVTWWTSTVDHFSKRLVATESKRETSWPGLTLQFLHGRLYTRNISVARWLNHREIAAEFLRLAPMSEPPDVILCSYPTIELSDAAVRYASKRGIPVLLDIRDLWPDEIAARIPRPMRFMAPMLLRPLYSAARRALGGAFGIVAISRTYIEWARVLGARRPSEGDLFVPMGYDAASFDIEPAATVGPKLTALGVDPSHKIVWFCGTFVGSIDLQPAIAAARLLEHDPTVQFVFTGSGERDAEWRAQSRDMANVVFTGWANREELAWLAAHAWVGLAAYKRGAMMSLTNKLFEYMAAGLPILSSLQGEAAALLAEHDVGLTYIAGDATDLAEKISRLATDAQLAARLAGNARRVFQHNYAAESVYSRFADHLENAVL
jgi:glycosyltransferase involved in cell wall biosynthesis